MILNLISGTIGTKNLNFKITPKKQHKLKKGFIKIWKTTIICASITSWTDVWSSTRYSYSKSRACGAWLLTCGAWSLTCGTWLDTWGAWLDTWGAWLETSFCFQDSFRDMNYDENTKIAFYLSCIFLVPCRIDCKSFGWNNLTSVKSRVCTFTWAMPISPSARDWTKTVSH